MNAFFSSRCSLILCLCLLGIPVTENVASAAEWGGILQASVFDFVADRSRMIQVSLVVVALGCALLWWRR